MSELLGYSTYDFYYTNSFHIYAIGLLIFFYLSIMKVVFNTYSIATAYSNYQTNSKIRKRYYDLFSTRDNLLYHISWAKSRNDHDEAKNMLVQLKHVDEVMIIYIVNLKNFMFVIYIYTI